MRNVIINAIYILAYYTGINHFFYFLNRYRQRIITFHNIIPESLFDATLHLGVSCSDSTFEFQIRQISKRFNITTQIGVASSCIITFDDGYINMHDIAHKILKRYSYKAVFFITSDLVEKQEILWIDKLLMYFSYLPDGKYLICKEEFIINSNCRLESYQKAYNFILSSYSLKDDFIRQLEVHMRLLNVDKDLLNIRFSALSYDNIEEMKMYGHLIACHSSSHDILSKLDVSELKKEINKCETFRRTLYNCDYYSYPFGSEKEVNFSVINTMKKSKFNYCFMNNWSFNSNNDSFKIQRMSLPNTTNKYLIDAYLSGFYYFLRRLLL